jgi:YVTN family beta-propeller protein
MGMAAPRANWLAGGAGAFLLLLAGWTSPLIGQERHPVYVGAAVCGSCHDGASMGHQATRWLLSKHARAYASLAAPEAGRIAALSGVPQESQESAACLGCHATGSDAEDWEKDATFSVKDGVQCEKCHGPGSEYVDEKVMKDREAAVRKGLVIPTPADCVKCHEQKGSHDMVFRRPPMDMAAALERIAHRRPPDAAFRKVTLPDPPVSHNPGRKYAGVMACAECHGRPEKGYQFSKWRTSRHAEAYAVLGTPAGRAMAGSMGVQGEPQRSPACLKCHATAYHEPAAGVLEAYSVYEGVGCEACHGAGSEHAVKDRTRHLTSGMRKPGPQTCLECHRDGHGKPFDYQASLKVIAHPARPPVVEEGPRYKTPINLAVSPDGKEVYVACEAANSVAVVSAASRRKVADIPVGGQPVNVAFSPDGRRAFISNRLTDTVSVIDTSARKVTATIPVGGEPHGLLTDRPGKLLYVLNTMADSISVVDAVTLKEVKRLAASRGPKAVALSPDGSRICLTNQLSRLVKFRTASVSEVTLIDTERAVVENRVEVPGANLLQGVAWHPSGKYAVFTLLRTKNLVPMTRILQGWTITNGLGILWADGRVDEVLLDEPGTCFPDPTDVAITRDGRFALVTSSSSDRVAVVDLPKLVGLLQGASEEERREVFPNHLGTAPEVVVKHIPTNITPRGIAIAPDGKTAFVACSLDDSLAVIDLGRLEAVARVDLGGPAAISQTRYGERIFNSAKNTFQRQFSCTTCHPDGHIDGLTYNTMPGGIGLGPVDNRTLRGIVDTAPFKWEGTNPSLRRQCGARLAVFFTRVQPFTEEEITALELYICTIPRPPNRFRPVGAKLTEAQRRGKAVFERTRTNDGRVIPSEQRCVTCHFPPLYTDRLRHDVGTKLWLDTVADFDTPHLNNIFDSAPYLHNGIADTLEEIWTRYNPDDKHGVTNDMTKDQLNDLIEYLKTL